MISILLLLTALEPQSEQAFLRSCEMTTSGWICHYQIPAVTAVPSPSGPAPAPGAAPAAAPIPVEPVRPSEAETRLMLRCADASWLSLCLPGERRQARALREAADAREARRLDVTRLLSEDRCDDAVRLALVNGDLDLARDARAFCALPSAD